MRSPSTYTYIIETERKRALSDRYFKLKMAGRHAEAQAVHNRLYPDTVASPVIDKNCPKWLAALYIGTFVLIGLVGVIIFGPLIAMLCFGFC